MQKYQLKHIYYNLQSTDRFKWTYEQEKKLIELFDHAISMNKYTLKDPTALGRDYIVEQFNLAFNMNITYGFFKNKLDEFKKSYKMWKFMMKSTGISVDPETSMIYASPEWWDNHEAVITTKYYIYIINY